MTYGVAETRDGYEICVLQEDGKHAMVASGIFRYEYEAQKAAQIINAVLISPLAADVTDALRRAGVFDPLGVGL